MLLSTQTHIYTHICAKIINISPCVIPILFFLSLRTAADLYIFNPCVLDIYSWPVIMDAFHCTYFFSFKL